MDDDFDGLSAADLDAFEKSAREQSAARKAVREEAQEGKGFMEITSRCFCISVVIALRPERLTTWVWHFPHDQLHEAVQSLVNAGVPITLEARAPLVLPDGPRASGHAHDRASQRPFSESQQRAHVAAREAPHEHARQREAEAPHGSQQSQQQQLSPRSPFDDNSQVGGTGPGPPSHAPSDEQHLVASVSRSVKLMLRSDGTIAASSSYHPALVAALRSIPLATWQASERWKTWSHWCSGPWLTWHACLTA
eukprot:jgi/Mesen1/9281/ME000060S08721